MIHPVSHWIGPKGYLEPVEFGSAISESSASRYDIRTTLSGKAWAYDRSIRGVVPGRSWSVDFSLLDPDDMAVLTELANDAGGGPFVFVPAASSISNVMHPGQTPAGMYAGGSSSLPGMRGADGRWHRYAAASSHIVIVPAVPRLPLAAAADVSGTDASITISVTDASGSVLSSNTVTDSTTGTRRISVAVPATPGAVSARVTVTSALSCRHQVTWTAESPARYGPPQSAAAVVVQSATSTHRGIYAGSPYFGGSLTIQEVSA